MTAEWQCTACDSTNRKLVAPTDTEVRDKCYSCKAKHVIRRPERPLTWHARAA
ncbi:MAG: hypothetical protein WD934_05435 [Gemmatimonadales bacterium]